MLAARIGRRRRHTMFIAYLKALAEVTNLPTAPFVE